jgi:acyl-CoA synthetase (AMP-forming)/AMP-acid ligase II
MSFAEVFAAADRLADTFSNLGITRGSIIGLTLTNTVEFVPLLLAAFRCSATVALISSRYRASELRNIQEGISPSCYVTSGSSGQQLQNELSSIVGNAKSVTPDGTALRLLFPERPPPNPYESQEETVLERLPSSEHALIKLSSGSTGMPKGIALSAANLLAEAENIVSTLQLTPNDQVLAAVPLTHSYGFDLGVLPMLYSGVSLVARDEFVPRRLLADMANKRTSIFLGVPSIYRTLVNIPVSSKPDLKHIRYLLSCTAPLYPDLINSFHDKFDAPICQHYGSSETGAATTHSPSKVLAHPTSVGSAMNNVTITVIDDRGRELGRGQEGEVVISSQAVALGYVMGAPAGESPFRARAYLTGDLGYVDDEGLVHLTGRKGHIINVGGLKVSPSEVVQVLERFPPISEAAVVGVAGTSGEEMVCAVVTLRQPTTADEIVAHCRDNIADYKVPRRIEIRDELPRGATGKIKLTAADLGL